MHVQLYGIFSDAAIKQEISYKKRAKSGIAQANERHGCGTRIAEPSSPMHLHT